MSSPTPHRFDHPVWDLRDVIGWVLDRDSAKFGRIHNAGDARSAINIPLSYKSQPRTERDPNALTTILHTLQGGRLVVHEGDAALPREHWGTLTEIDLRSAISRGLWFFREDVLGLWPVEVAPVETAAPKAPECAGDQDRMPNWAIWSHIPKVKTFQAVALSLNIDPNKIRHHPYSWMTGKRLFNENQEFKDRIFIVEQNLEKIGVANFAAAHYHGEDPLIRLERFTAWARRIGWTLPREFSEAAADGTARPIEAVCETDEPEAAKSEEKAQRIEIPKKREALQSWIAQHYPEGIPAGTSKKAIAREFEADTKISVDERTVGRALGRG